ncbi:MAG: aminomethyl-transferring glycine dehydrogenase subunit GcvPA [Spirochaetales bacterium]
MPYISNTDEDRHLMLDALGYERIEELFGAVPESVRYPKLSIPEGMTELEVVQEMRRIADTNESGGGTLSFLGGGAYEHFIPAVVPFLASRGEFATTYTPYQAEASQGTLQSIFEYQSMLTNLYGIDVVNASHYDGSTAFAESALMALNCVRNRSRILLAPGVHPEYMEVLRTYTAALDVTIDVLDDASWRSDPYTTLSGAMTDETAVFMVQTPDFFGRLSDLRDLASVVHEAGALFAVHADPVSLAIYRSPGEFGADIITGDGQPLGIPVSFGGPSLGIFGCREKLVRKMPGRLVGQTSDGGGRRGYVLTLNTREQHIRRAKATSNICTNQGLMALRSAIYLAALGPNGLQEVATLCHNKSHYAAELICAIDGIESYDTSPFFREFAVRLPIPAREAVDALRDRDILPGVDLGRYDEELSNVLLISVTETKSKADIDRLAFELAAILKSAEPKGAGLAAGGAI